MAMLSAVGIGLFRCYLNMALLARASGNTLQFTNNCFYKFSLNLSTSKLYKKLSFCYASCLKNTLNTRCSSTAYSLDTNSEKKFITFEDVMSQRRKQARRSILVQVQAESSKQELYNYCSHFGTVKEMHHYTLTNGVHFILIEFNSLADVESINRGSTHMNTGQNYPVTSPMLWFRVGNSKKMKKNFSRDIPFTVTDGTCSISTEKLNSLIYHGKSISDQMKILYDTIKLSDTDIRLRFISAKQIESCLSGMFADISVLPFGSTVNGFGKNGCDLDLVLKLQMDTRENPDCRLVYHAKSTDGKYQTPKIMETISDVMQLFLPGISSIRKILRARVPIIKYHQTLTGLECDLSMTNTIGIHMSELLYIYGEMDWRVRPLIFTIRMWAKSVLLTNSSPGCWITNFSLTLLVLFYLQQKKILPSLKELVKLADKNDVRIADDHVDCTFLRDISRLPKSTFTNQETLDDLLTNFFIYYASFDFVTKAISLNEGEPLNKPKESNVYIFNPFEQGLNITKNMNVQETERLKIEMRNAAWLFDCPTEINSEEWGLLSLFRQKVKSKEINQAVSNSRKNRIVELSTLFKETLSQNGAKNDKRVAPGAEKRTVSASLGVLSNQRTSNTKKKSSRRHQGKR